MKELKETGNKLFRKQRYDKACEVYLEALLEIEEMIEGNAILRKNEELKQLEISCRLNYSTCKAKIG